MPWPQRAVLPTCAICQDDGEAGSVRYATTQCGHIFHKECLEEWRDFRANQAYSIRCPTCTGELGDRYEGYHSSRSSQFITLHSLSLEAAPSAILEELAKKDVKIEQLESKNKDLLRDQVQQNIRLAQQRREHTLTVERLTKQLEAKSTDLTEQEKIKDLLKLQVNKLKDELQQLKEGQLKRLTGELRALEEEKAKQMLARNRLLRDQKRQNNEERFKYQIENKEKFLEIKRLTAESEMHKRLLDKCYRIAEGIRWAISPKLMAPINLLKTTLSKLEEKIHAHEDRFHGLLMTRASVQKRTINASAYNNNRLLITDHGVSGLINKLDSTTLYVEGPTQSIPVMNLDPRLFPTKPPQIQDHQLSDPSKFQKNLQSFLQLKFDMRAQKISLQKKLKEQETRVMNAIESRSLSILAITAREQGVKNASCEGSKGKSGIDTRPSPHFTPPKEKHHQSSAKKQSDDEVAGKQKEVTMTAPGKINELASKIQVNQTKKEIKEFQGIPDGGTSKVKHQIDPNLNLGAEPRFALDDIISADFTIEH